jgi:hypothetical protein
VGFSSQALDVETRDRDVLFPLERKLGESTAFAILKSSSNQSTVSGYVQWRRPVFDESIKKFKRPFA